MYSYNWSVDNDDLFVKGLRFSFSNYQKKMTVPILAITDISAKKVKLSFCEKDQKIHWIKPQDSFGFVSRVIKN